MSESIIYLSSDSRCGNTAVRIGKATVSYIHSHLPSTIWQKPWFMERMAVGEECGVDIMESAILCALKAWNEKVDEFRELLAKESITQADKALEMSAGDAAAVQSKMQARISHISSALRKYDVCKTGGALKTLGLYLGIYNAT